MNDSFMLGYDYAFLSLSGLKVPLYASVESPLIVVGGSNAGKSTATLYWLYKLQKYKIDFYIAIISYAKNSASKPEKITINSCKILKI